LTFTIQVKTNQSQLAKIPVSGRVTLQPETWYTCPAGKRAVCKGRVICTGTGAAAEARLSFAGIIVFRWVNKPAGQPFININIQDDTAITFSNNGVAVGTLINVYRTFEIELAAGETVISSQDAGTNAEINLFMEVEELAA